jgi:hypothetical protein
MVRLAVKRYFRDASCCIVLVMNGADGRFGTSFTLTSVTV